MEGRQKAYIGSSALAAMLLIAAIFAAPMAQANEEARLHAIVNRLAEASLSSNEWPAAKGPSEWLDRYYVTLPALDSEFSIYSDETEQRYADDVFRMTNQQRDKKGHPPLRRSAWLDAVAQAHAKHMADRNFFEHEDLYGMEVWDRVEVTDSPTFWLSGENIAAGQRSPEHAMQSWMDSSGHKKNIRRDGYEYIGVGAYYDRDSEYGWYWVQVFVSFDRSPNGHDWIEPGELRPDFDF